MRQAELNRAVARATGETVSTIQRLGFLLADPINPANPEALGPLVIDWDELALQRHTGELGGGRHEPAAA